MVKFSLFPREEKFFDLFESSVENLVTAANELSELLQNYQDVPSKAERITELEHRGDAITHQIMEQVHRTFVTPLDREDIALLAHSLDDVLDFIEGAAVAMLLYKIEQPTERARQQASLLVKAADEVGKAIPRLRHRHQLRAVLEHGIEINRLENEADEVIRLAVVELFENGSDIAEIIKWREIYENIESAIDRCEDVADVLEGVVLKHA